MFSYKPKPQNLLSVYSYFRSQHKPNFPHCMQSDVLFDTYVAPKRKKLIWVNVMWQKTLCGNVMVFSIETFHLKSKYRYQTRENRKLKSDKICPVFNNGPFFIYHFFLHCLHELNPDLNLLASELFF